jgi:hypothetical protein
MQVTYILFISGESEGTMQSIDLDDNDVRIDHAWYRVNCRQSE